MTKKRKPFNKSTGRDYKDEYTKFQSSDKAKKDRASRNAARAKLEKAGRVKKGDGKDVDHKSMNPRDNSDKNLRVVSKSKNRGHGKTGNGKRKKT
jgi:hypothetical protein